MLIKLIFAALSLSSSLKEGAVLAASQPQRGTSVNDLPSAMKSGLRSRELHHFDDDYWDTWAHSTWTDDYYKDGLCNGCDEHLQQGACAPGYHCEQSWACWGQCFGASTCSDACFPDNDDGPDDDDDDDPPAPAPAARPTPAPVPAPGGSDGDGPTIIYNCFSASATIQTATKGIIPMKDLSVGDMVLTDSKTNKYEEVYAFGHYNPFALAPFLRIHIQDSNNALEMTHDHMLQVNGRFSRAGSVKVGDTLITGNGSATQVTKIHNITLKDGVFAPLTPSGTLLVDNILVSNYISLLDLGDDRPVFANGLRLPFSQQFGIHMMLSPYRMLCIGLKIDGLCHAKDEEGMSLYVHWGIQLAKYADTLSYGMLFLLVTICLVLFVPLFLLETMFGAQNALLAGFMFAGALQWLKQCHSDSSKQKSL